MKYFLAALTCIFTIPVLGDDIGGDHSIVKQTESLLNSLNSNPKSSITFNAPTLGPLKIWELSVDTLTHKVPATSIRSLYDKTCSKMIELYGADPLDTYRKTTPEGKYYQFTLLQFSNAVEGDWFLMAGYIKSAEFESYTFQFIKGTCDVTKLEKMDTWKIQENVEQAGTGQPATRPESKSEGVDKPHPESEGRSR